MKIRDIVEWIKRHGGITLKRVDATELIHYRGPGIAVGLDHDAIDISDHRSLATAIAEHALSGNVSGYVGYWMEGDTLHRDRCVVLADRYPEDIGYAGALAVQYGQKSVYHFGTSKVVLLQDAKLYHSVSRDIKPIWFDVMAIGPENLIGIHADSVLPFGVAAPATSCLLYRGYRGEVQPIPLSDEAFTEWYRVSEASSYFKHRASDRQSQTRRIACRKVGE